MTFNFDIAFSGIKAGQKAVQVAQTNIANANTAGYARQELDLKVSSVPGMNNQIGNGVISEHVNRIKDDFLIEQSRGEKSKLGYYQNMKTSLSSMENIFNETSDGSISKQLARFFNAWEELSKFPEETSYRHALVAQASNMSNKFNEIDGELTSLKSITDNDMKMQMNRVNELVEKVGDINAKINKSGSAPPNGFLDERDRYIDELSSLVDVKVTKNISNDQVLDIKVGGVSLVSGSDTKKIEALFDRNEDKWLLTAGSSMMNLKSGSLTANLEARNNNIPKRQQELNDFVATLIKEVNDTHVTGYGLDNSTGLDFFNGSDAGSIQVNNILKTSPGKIATSSEVDTAGNSDVAKLIANLKDAKVMDGGTSNPINFYNGFAVNMATELNVISDNMNVHTSISTQVEEQRQSVQGVNIDEELANLLKFEQYYAANSKALSSVDKMYDTLLQMF
jgi:flagellar hook-associated protein 1